MCRYYYRDGLCANSSVEVRACIGLDQCPESSKDFKISSEKSCGYDRWYGLYCAKYKRFFCADVGNCETFEDYMTGFAKHISDAKGPRFPNEMQI